MSNTLSSTVYELLKKVVNNIDNYSVFVHGLNKKGEGFLGQMEFVSLQDKNGGEMLHFAIKQAFTAEAVRKEVPVRSYYLNEIYFYDTVWSSFQKFQVEMQSAKPFDKIPRCFATTTEDGNEKIVLENLRYQGFEMFDKTSTFDKQHVEFIFKQYGRFHALSFAYKASRPNEYSKISDGLIDMWCKGCELKSFQDWLNNIVELCSNNLHAEEDAQVMQKFKRYVENGIEIFYNSNSYKGNHSVILHGDCWSNNMMFKYDDVRNLIDVRFLDFQLSKVGTPVTDLSYCFYSGGSREIFNELDYYLKIYHSSLLEAVKELGCNPDNIYSFEELKNEWRQYCKMGFIMGLMIWRTKVTYEEGTFDLTEIKEVGQDITKGFMASKYDEDIFKERTRDLILHMHENDFL